MPVILGGVASGRPEQTSLPMDKDDHGMSPVHKRGMEQLPEATDKRPKNAAMLDLDMLKGLLADQANTIMGAHEKSIDAAVKKLQETQDARMDSFETKLASTAKVVDQVKQGQDDLETRVAKLESGGGFRSTAVGSTSMPNEDRYRNVIIVGGWTEEVRKQVLLKQLRGALATLRLTANLDSDPYTTGPRKKVGFIKLTPRKNEEHEAFRSRLHSFVAAFAEHHVLVSEDQPTSRMWAGYSRPPEQRARASHASWVKRTIARIDESRMGDLDLEHSTGSAWLGAHKVACAVQQIANPEGVQGLVVNPRQMHQPWVRCDLIANELGVDMNLVRKTLEEQKR